MEAAASVTQVTCLKGNLLQTCCDNRQKLCNGAGCFTTVKTVGRIYSLQLVVAALLLFPEHADKAFVIIRANKWDFFS